MRALLRGLQVWAQTQACLDYVRDHWVFFAVAAIVGVLLIAFGPELLAGATAAAAALSALLYAPVAILCVVLGLALLAKDTQTA